MNIVYDYTMYLELTRIGLYIIHCITTLYRLYTSFYMAFELHGTELSTKYPYFYDISSVM